MRRRGRRAKPQHLYCALILFIDSLMAELWIPSWIQIESCRKKRWSWVKSGTLKYSHFQGSCINAVALHLCSFFTLSDTYLVDMYPHTTTPPWITRRWAEMCWAEYEAKHQSEQCVWELCFSMYRCLCVCTSAPSLAHAGFLGLGHPVIFGRHGNGSEVTWKYQSSIR